MENTFGSSVATALNESEVIVFCVTWGQNHLPTFVKAVQPRELLATVYPNPSCSSVYRRTVDPLYAGSSSGSRTASGHMECGYYSPNRADHCELR